MEISRHIKTNENRNRFGSLNLNEKYDIPLQYKNETIGIFSHKSSNHQLRIELDE